MYKSCINEDTGTKLYTNSAPKVWHDALRHLNANRWASFPIINVMQSVHELR